MRESLGSNKPGPTLWDSLAAIVADEGLVLFDLHLPTARAGTLRVFIAKPKSSAPLLEVPPLEISETSASESPELQEGDGDSGESEAGEGPIVITEGGRSGVTLEDCAKVSRKITEFFESGAFDRSTNLGFEWATDDWSIEVSSPGINRPLSRDDHFSGAVGERVRLRIIRGGMDRIPGIKSPTVFGEVLSFEGRTLSLREEESGEVIAIPRDLISEARVDFDFGGGPKRKFSPNKGKGRKGK